MTPDDIAALAAAELGEDVAADVSFGQVTIDVPAARWAQAATWLRDDDRIGAGFFDWLSAYDDRDAGLAVVVHVWSISRRHSIRLRTRVPRTGGHLATLTSVWPGAEWHERETFEMFGIGFDDHPNLVPLLLPDGFEGNPLRKEFVLASRVAKSWPGQKEPGESDADVEAPAAVGADPADTDPTDARAVRRPRRRMLPPGVPEPGEWGPDQ